MKKSKRILFTLIVALSALFLSSCSCANSGKRVLTLNIEGNTENTIVFKSGSIPERPEDPVKEGYAFKGWYLDDTFETEYNFDEPLTKRQTLYALFVKTYQIQFLDGEQTLFPAAIVESGMTAQETQTPVKEGYVFKGWYEEQTFQTAYDFDNPVTEDKTLYALFVKTHQVQFMDDTQSISRTQVIESGNAAHEPQTPVKEGFIFKGWYLDKTFEMPYDFKMPISNDLTLYAKFNEGCKIKFVANTGISISDLWVEKGVVPTRPADPVQVGFAFVGWYLDETHTQPYNFDTAFTQETILYAAFEETTYVVSFSTNGGTVIEDVTYLWSQTPVAPENPSNGNLFFYGWYLDEDYTQKYEFDRSLKVNTILYALFTEHMEIYDIDGLLYLAQNPDKKYVLKNDINLFGERWEPINNFSGELDGNGHKIHYFAISTTTATTGFINTNNGIIKNLTLEDVSVSSSYTKDSHTVGTLAGINNGTIENCRLENITASTYTEWITSSSVTRYAYVGGAVGYNKGTITNCQLQGTVSSEIYGGANYGGYSIYHYYYLYTGGMIGINDGTIFNVSVFTDISTKATVYGAYYWANSDYGNFVDVRPEVGGIMGRNNGALTKGNFEGDITLQTTCSNNHGENYITLGGIAAVTGNNSTIEGCYAKGTINDLGKGTYMLVIGGAFGNNYGYAQDCYAHMDISIASNLAAGYMTVGGFVGNNWNVIKSAYANGTIKGGSLGTVGGFIGWNRSGGSVNGGFCSTDIGVTSATLGAFLGNLESGSTLQKCYYDTNASVLVNGTAYVSAAVTGVAEKTITELYSREFLIEELYWQETVWEIDGINAPKFFWAPAVEQPEEDDSQTPQPPADDFFEDL